MAKTISLSTPLKRGDKEIKEITITDVMKQSGTLRGLSLRALLNADVDTLLTLLPRVTEPMLLEHELASMPPWDFQELAAGAIDFLNPPLVEPGKKG